METTLYNNLHENGTLLPDGSVHKDKLNLISGAHTPDFVEAVWTLTDHDPDILNRMGSVLDALYTEGRKNEMLELLRLFYGIIGLDFPEEIESLIEHSEARSHFLFEFLLDFEDVASELIAEEMGPI